MDGWMDNVMFNFRFWLFGAKRNLVLKPLNSLSSIKDYLVYFENLVVSSIHLFSQTSSLLIQERVLFMMVQLLHLKVRYDLLDCNGTFLDSVNLIVNLMESGSVKGGAQLVPHLFQFLVMLAHDQSKKVSIPEVMQKCDAVMASNQNMTSFAIPALQPLVLYLFVRPNPLESTELRTQREVALNMLLRLIDYSRVIQLLICVLECYQSNAQEWSTISSIVFAALLPPLGRLQASLDTPQTLSSLHQLLTAMTPSSISIQALLLTLSKQTHLSSITSLTRWLSLLSIVLRLLSVIFPEDTLKTNINNFQLTPPTVNFVGITIEPLSWPHPSDEKTRPLNYDITQLAMFLVDSLHLGLSSLSQLLYDPLVDHSMLSLVLSDILLVIRILVGDDYVLLREALGSLPLPQELFISFLSLSHSYPSLIISFTSLLITCGGSNIKEWMNKILVGLQDPLTPHQILLVHCLFSLVPSCSGWVEWFDPAHHSTLLLSSPHGPALIKDGYFNDIMMTSLRSLIDHSPSSSLTDSMNVLCVVESAGSHLVSHPSVFKLITDKFVGHSNKAISLKAMSVLELLIELGCEVSPDEVNDIMKTRCVIRERSPSLWNKLDNLTDHQMTASDVVDPLTPLASSDAVITVDEEWHKELIVESFPSLTPSTVAKLLLHFDAKSLDELLNHAQFDPALLEECLVHSIFLILTRCNSMLPSLEYTKNISIMLPTNSETLFLTSVNCLMKHVQKWVELDSSDHVRACHLTRSLVWFLISLPLLPSESMGLTDDMNNDLIRFSLMSLSVQSSLIPHIDTVAIQSSIHLCLMVLQNKGLVSMVTDEWVVSVTRLLAKIVQHEYDFVVDTPTTNQTNELVHQLNSVLTFLLMSSGDDSLLHWSLKSLSVTLARHQMFFPSIYFPPILTSMEGGGPISIQLLDRSLADSDILQEYMQRTNVIGWKSRNHFEELWMQLLGVLNSPQPSEEMLPEEMVAHSMGLVSGVRGLTSLLMSTILRPSPGNPSSSVPMHTHRNKDFNFLSSPAGKKLLPHRALIEFYILKDTGLRPNSHAHYQLPLMNQGTTFPPVYCRNLERPLGSAHLTPGQLSYTSLVPVILKVDVTKTTSTSLGPSEVDIRSCLMSIIDFYKHLLSQSIDLLLLHHIVSSTVMLSDLFVLSSQYEWMFDTFMSLIDSHPIEDELTESLLVFGVIKCATVLRLVMQYV
jgi:huntingtin